MRRIVWAVTLLILSAAVILWWGFRSPVRQPDPVPRASRLLRKAVLHDGLPAPLQYYLTQTVSRTPPVTRTAVVWGTGRLRVQIGPMRLWLPLSWHEAIDVDRGFVWRGDVMWFRWSVYHIEDRYANGQAEERTPSGRMRGPWRDQAHAMRARAELFWLPSALVTTTPDRHERAIEWRARSEWDASMRYGGPRGLDSLVAQFDPHTRALTSLAGMRCRADSTRHPWRVRPTAWGNPGGLMIPTAGDALWGEEPYYAFEVAGVAYNVPVDDWFDRSRAVQVAP